MAITATTIIVNPTSGPTPASAVRRNTPAGNNTLDVGSAVTSYTRGHQS